jgi:hypothetical protein
VVELQKGDTCGVGALTFHMLADESENGVAEEEELVLITDSLEVLKLSVVGILEGLKKFLVKLLQEADE